MPIPLDLYQIIPGTLPGGDGYCFLGWQRFGVDLLSRARIQLRDEIGATFWNISSATPPADRRIYPWLNLGDGRVYNYSWTFGVWISPIPFSFAQLWFGSPESALWSLDGGTGEDPRQTLPDGSANPAYFNPTPIQGAVWQVEHRLDGRFPLGAGVIPYTDPANPLLKISVASGDTSDSAGVSGEYNHILTQQEGGLGAHQHAFGKSNNAAGSGGDDAFFAQQQLTTTPGYSGTYVTGSNGVIRASLKDADLFTLPPIDATGAIPTTAAFNKQPLFLGLYFVTRTNRQFYVVAP